MADVIVNTFVIDPFPGTVVRNTPTVGITDTPQRQFINSKPLPLTTPHHVATQPPYEGGPPNNGTISGVCIENNVPVGGCKVHLYYKPTGELIRTMYSEGDGTFTFEGLNQNIDEYYAVALLDGAPIVYNFVTHANLRPLVADQLPPMAVVSPQRLVHPSPSGITQFGSLVVFSQDGNRLFVNSLLNGITTRIVVFSLQGSSWTYHSTISPNFVLDSTKPTTVAPGNGSTFIFRTSTGEIAKYSWNGSAWTLTFITSILNPLAISSDGIMIARQFAGNVRLFSFNNGAQTWNTLLSTITAQGGGSFFGTVCRFSADGAVFAVVDLVKSDLSPLADKLRLTIYIQTEDLTYQFNTLATLSLPSNFINTPSQLLNSDIKISMSEDGSVIVIASAEETSSGAAYVVSDGSSWTSYKQGFVYTATYSNDEKIWIVASPLSSPSHSDTFTPWDSVEGEFIYAPRFGGGVDISNDGTKIIVGETGWRTPGEIIASSTLLPPRQINRGRTYGFELQNGSYQKTFDYTPPEDLAMNVGSALASSNTHMACGVPSANAVYVSKYSEA